VRKEAHAQLNNIFKAPYDYKHITSLLQTAERDAKLQRELGMVKKDLKRINVFLHKYMYSVSTGYESLAVVVMWFVKTRHKIRRLLRESTTFRKLGQPVPESHRVRAAGFATKLEASRKAVPSLCILIREGFKEEIVFIDDGGVLVVSQPSSEG